MKITFLGTAAATSFPLVYCCCQNCQDARAHKGKSIRKRSSILIDDMILIDQGPDFVTAMNMYNKDITKIKILLQTHHHSDHFDAGHFVTRMTDYATINIPHLEIVAHNKCLKAMSKMIVNNEEIDIFDDAWQKDLNISLTMLEHGQSALISDYKITALESLHDINNGSMIYLIEKQGVKILYATDTLMFSKNTLCELKNIKLNCLIMDHTYGDVENCGGHLNQKQFVDQLEILRENNTIDNSTKIFATHLSHEGIPYHEKFEKQTQGLYDVAYDGLEIQF